MATTYRTVSDEMALTDWTMTRQSDAPVANLEQRRPNFISLSIAIVVGAAMLAAVFYLLPAGSY